MRWRFQVKTLFRASKTIVRKWRDWHVGRTFFYFFRLLQAFASIRVAWFVRIRCPVGPLVVKTAVIIQVNQHGTKCAVKVTYRLSATLLVVESQPDSESEQTKLLGYSQNLGEVEKNKKKFVQLAHLAISLLKPRGEEIDVFPQIQM